MHKSRARLLGIVFFLSPTLALRAAGPIETVWIEAEHLQGIKGNCWPMGTPEARKTAGNWGISGPGWAAEWNQGGESGFLSIACGADDDKAEASADFEVPASGDYQVWVRYRDVREATNRFQIRLEQQASQPWVTTYGEHALFDEDNVMKLYWGWAFGWEGHPATLKKGNARLVLRSAFKESDCRQIDAIVLTTDPAYRPFVKERPANYAWQVLEAFRTRHPDRMEPLARSGRRSDVPLSWKMHTFHDDGFRFLWNVDQFDWLTQKPDRVLYPHRLPAGEHDKDVFDEFKKTYAGAKDVPIFSDPRIVPVFHGSGPLVMDPAFAGPKWGGHVTPGLQQWLDHHPDRPWGTMMNYHADVPMAPEAVDRFLKYRGRYVGSVSGESLGYFDQFVDAKARRAAVEGAKTRRELADVLGEISMRANAAKWRKVYGRDLDDPYREVIPVIGMQYYPLAFHWGARTVGCEMTVVTGAMQAANLAMLRGAARQYDGMVLSYRSGNFGDSSATFNYSPNATVKQLIENYYSPYSGAGMTWWNFDGWYQYMAGSAMFYEEGGADSFWKPGGLTVAGVKDLQLSPRGKLTDRFLRLTAKEPDRGTPFTPVAILMDYANGVSTSTYRPSLFEIEDVPKWSYTAAGNADHVRNVQEYLGLAYYPIGPRSQEPLTATTESFVPGVFGDIFDVVYADPDLKRWHTLDTYPVTIIAGDIELTADEGRRLSQYVENGGTLFAADGQLRGPGAAELKLPKLGEQQEAAGYLWQGDAAVRPSQLYRFRAISGGNPLATDPGGATVCAAFDQGQGRLVFLSVPYALGVDKQVVPFAAGLFLRLTRGLMPVEVDGDVQWLVNRSKDGWLVTLINSAGVHKCQQGIAPTDFRENRTVRIHAHEPITAAHDRLLETDRFDVADNSVSVLVPAGAVRIMEVR